MRSNYASLVAFTIPMVRAPGVFGVRLRSERSSSDSTLSALAFLTSVPVYGI